MRACLIKHKVTTAQAAQAAQAYKVLYKPRTKQEGTGVEQAPASLVRTEPPSFRSIEQNAITKVNSSGNLVPRLHRLGGGTQSFFHSQKLSGSKREKKTTTKTQSTFSSIENKVRVLRSL